MTDNRPGFSSLGYRKWKEEYISEKRMTTGVKGGWGGEGKKRQVPRIANLWKKNEATFPQNSPSRRRRSWFFNIPVDWIKECNRGQSVCEGV